MMDNKFIGLMVGLAVGMLLVSGFLWPIVADATTTETTFKNDGYFYMQKITAADTETYTLTYEYDSDAESYSYTYNGEAIDTSSWPVAPMSLTLATDGESWLFRAGLEEYTGLQAIGGNFASAGGHNIWSVEASFSNGAVSATFTDSENTTTTKTETYSELWIYSPTPTDYIMKKANSTAYLFNDSEYLAMGVTLVTEWATVIKVMGTVEEFTATIVYPPNLTTTVTDKVIDSETVSGYNELNALDKLTFTVSDGTTTVNATYSYFIVPAEVTAVKSWHLDTTQIALVTAIGTLGAIVLIAAAAGSIRRLD